MYATCDKDSYVQVLFWTVQHWFRMLASNYSVYKFTSRIPSMSCRWQVGQRKYETQCQQHTGSAKQASNFAFQNEFLTYSEFLYWKYLHGFNLGTESESVRSSKFGLEYIKFQLSMSRIDLCDVTSERTIWQFLEFYFWLLYIVVTICLLIG